MRTTVLSSLFFFGAVLTAGAVAVPSHAQDIAAAPTSQQPTASQLRVGQWVQAKGKYEKPVFRADEIEVLPPEDKETLIGVVERILDADRFVLLGQQVHHSAKTEWKDITASKVEGAMVKVTGRYHNAKKFSAREVSVRGAGRSSLEGRIDRLETRGDQIELTIMGYQVRVAADSELESELPVDQLALAPERLQNPSTAARDDDDDLPGNIELAPDLRLGAQVEFRQIHEDEYDLDKDSANDRDDTTASLRAELVWTPSEDFYALLGARHSFLWRDEADDGFSKTDDGALNEAYGYWKNVQQSGWDLQVGRQDFDEPREWLYDANLDAIRGILSRPTYRVELSVSTILHDGSDVDEDLFNTMAYVSNNSRKRHLAAYVIDRRDGSDNFTHVGGRVLGEWLPESEVWLELAALRGDNAGQDLKGYAFDVGATWAPSNQAPALTLGYAFGSGDDDPSNGTNETFRQTGFHDNNDKFSGLTSYRYYGELMRPELANLSILTLGLGGRFAGRQSLDLIAHKYTQVEAFDELVDSDLDMDPNGVDDDLGWEVDLVYGNGELTYLDLELVAGYFEPGDAFDDADAAWLAALQLRFKF